MKSFFETLKKIVEECMGIIGLIIWTPIIIIFTPFWLPVYLFYSWFDSLGEDDKFDHRETSSVSGSVWDQIHAESLLILKDDTNWQKMPDMNVEIQSDIKWNRSLDNDLEFDTNQKSKVKAGGKWIQLNLMKIETPRSIEWGGRFLSLTQIDLLFRENWPCTSCVYVLHCDSNKYYVGETTWLKGRMLDHFVQDRGSVWTKLYPAREIVAVFRLNVWFKDKVKGRQFAEEAIAKVCRELWGDENVAGGIHHKAAYARKMLKEQF